MSLYIRIFHTSPRTTHDTAQKIVLFLLRDISPRTIQFVDDFTYNVAILFHDRIDISTTEKKKLVKNLEANNCRIKQNCVKILVNPLPSDEICPNLLCDLTPDIVVGYTNSARYPTALSVECPPWFYSYYDAISTQDAINTVNQRIHDVNPERTFITLNVTDASDKRQVASTDTIAQKVARYFPNANGGTYKCNVPFVALDRLSLHDTYLRLKDYVFFICSDTTQLFLAAYSGCIPIYVCAKYNVIGEIDRILFNTSRILFAERSNFLFLEQLLNIYRQYLPLAVEHIKQPSFTDCVSKLQERYDAIARQIATVIATKMGDGDHRVSRDVLSVYEKGYGFNRTKDTEPNCTMLKVHRRRRILDCIVLKQNADTNHLQSRIRGLNDTVDYFIVFTFGVYPLNLFNHPKLRYVPIPAEVEELLDEMPDELYDIDGKDGGNKPDTFCRIVVSESICQASDIHPEDIIVFSQTPDTNLSVKYLRMISDIVTVCRTPVSFGSDGRQDVPPRTIAFQMSHLDEQVSLGTLWSHRHQYVRLPFV